MKKTITILLLMFITNNTFALAPILFSQLPKEEKQKKIFEAILNERIKSKGSNQDCIIDAINTFNLEFRKEFGYLTQLNLKPTKYTNAESYTLSLREDGISKYFRVKIDKDRCVEYFYISDEYDIYMKQEKVVSPLGILAILKGA